MNKKFAPTVIALAVFGALLVWLFWFDPKPKDEREEAERTVVKAERDAIDRIELANPSGTFVFEKKDDAWRLVAPTSYPAEEAVTSQMLNALSSLVAMNVVYETPTAEQKKAAGLDPAVTTVKFRAAGKEQTLRIGKAHSREEGYYVSGEKAPIYMGRKWSLDVFAKGLDDFRRRKIFAFDKDDVRNVQVQSPGGAFVDLSRAESLAPWHTNGKPFEGRADRGKVNGVLTKASNLRVKEFLATPPKLEPRYEIRFALVDGTEERITVGQDWKPEGWLAAIGTSGTIVVTTGEKPLADPKEIASWKDPQLFDFVVDDVSKLDVEVDGQTVAVTRDADGTWKAGNNAVGPEATAFLRDAKLAKALETSADAKGTGKPVVKATWITPTETQSIVIGDPKPGTKPVQRWAKTHETKGAVLIQEDLLSHARALKDAASRVAPATSTTSAEKGTINVTVDKGS